MTTHAPTPGAPTFPPGYEPPKKKHTVRNVILVLLGLFILGLGGCMALVGTAVNEVDKALKEEAKNDVPVAVAESGAFTHDDYSIAKGWAVTEDDFGGTSIEGLKVTNDGDTARSAQFTFSFYQGAENLGEVECTSNEMQPGDSSAMECISFDDTISGYDTIKVADMW